jgi:hypothetical protein
MTGARITSSKKGSPNSKNHQGSSLPSKASSTHSKQFMMAKFNAQKCNKDFHHDLGCVMGIPLALDDQQPLLRFNAPKRSVATKKRNKGTVGA